MARAWAEVDLAAVRANVAALVAHAGTTVCAVVKADGYGHGAAPVARAALAGGARWLAVAQVPEALALREAGVDAPVLLLCEPAPEEIAAAVAAELRLTVCSPGIWEGAASAAARAGRPAQVHLKVDTGMHRLGVPPADALSAAKAIDSDPHLELEGVWTHCPVADEPGNPFTARQLERFGSVIDELARHGIEPPVRHAANSAAAIAHPAGRLDLVRCGIAIYGIPPAPAMAGAVPLRPAMRLRSQVCFLQRVEAGEGISYGHRYRFERDAIVATVPIGYADGVPRALGLRNQEVLLGGRRRPIVGVVTMDQLMVDLGAPGRRGAADVSVGDEVVLLGDQDGESVSAQEWADRLGTIAYEVVCAIGPRVQRRYLHPPAL